MTTTTTTPALFRFQFHTTYISHTHPVPTFLTQPAPSQQGSSAFASAFIDVLSVITNQHHDECMAAITPSPCLSCQKPGTDCLKFPKSYLHLVEPMVIITLAPTCGSAGCERRLRAGLLEVQKREAEAQQVELYSGANYGKMSCAECGAEDGKRCAGCGTVAYCGRECQRMGWKGHKRYCGRKGLGQDLSGVKGPVEMI